jgi:hypothetical protein
MTFQNGGETVPLFEEDYFFIRRNVSTEFPSVLVTPDDHKSFTWRQSTRGALSPPQFPQLSSTPCIENATSPFSSILPDNNDDEATGISGIFNEETKTRQKRLINGIRLPMRMGSTTNPFLTNVSWKRTFFSSHFPARRVLRQDRDEPFTPRTPKRTLEDSPTMHMPPACRPKYLHEKQDQNLPPKVLLPDF